MKDLEGANLGRGLLEVMQAHDRIASLTIEQDHRSRPPKSARWDNARRLAEAIAKDGPLHTLDQILEDLSERPDR